MFFRASRHFLSLKLIGARTIFKGWNSGAKNFFTFEIAGLVGFYEVMTITQPRCLENFGWQPISHLHS